MDELTVVELRRYRAPNTFPVLPVREGEDVLVWLAALPDLAASETLVASLPGTPEVWGLTPTARSLLHGGTG